MPSRKTALITGGSRGIGLGIATCLAQEGWDLAICGRRTADEVAEAMQTLRKSGGDVFYTQADVSSTEDRRQLLDQIRTQFNRLNLLVNNAGVGPRQRVELLQASEESFEEVLRINLQGPYFLSQAVAQWFLEQRQEDPEFSGCIINISSVSAEMASPTRGEYCVAKAGMSMGTRLWAVALAEHDIPVYEIRPGITRTDLTAGVQDKYDALIKDGLLPQARWGEPEDTGKAVAMLARGDLPYSTGQVIYTDGGLILPRL